MRPLLCALVVLFFAAFAIAERPTFKFRPIHQFSGQAYADFTVPLSALQDMFAYADASEQSIIFMRRNSDGSYSRNITVPFDNAEIYMQTNGRFIMFLANAPTPNFLKINGNGESADVSAIPNAYGGQLLSDDTFVSLDAYPDDNGTTYLRTYEYQSAYNNWTSIEAAELVAPYGQSSGYLSSYRATDTHLVVNDFSNGTFALISIYERQPDKSWKFVESFNAKNSLLVGSVTYNGVDTVVISNPFAIVEATQPTPTYGTFQICTKSNGVWTQQTYNATTLGYKPAAFVGVVVRFIGPDVLLISASLDGYNINNPSDALPNGGKILLLTRDSNGLWKDTLDLIGDAGLFGLGFGINDYDIIAMEVTGTGNALPVSVLVAPLCLYKPINVTCFDQQLSDCSEIDTSSLYTVNNPECGDVDVSLDNFNIATGSNTIKATISFTRPFDDNSTPVTCIATVTCPAPPVTVVPVALAPSGRTSSAFATEISGISAVVMMILSLLQ